MSRFVRHHKTPECETLGMVWIGLLYDEVSRMISVVLGDGSLLSKRAILSRSRNAEIDRTTVVCLCMFGVRSSVLSFGFLVLDQYT